MWNKAKNFSSTLKDTPAVKEIVEANNNNNWMKKKYKPHF